MEYNGRNGKKGSLPEMSEDGFETVGCGVSKRLKLVLTKAVTSDKMFYKEEPSDF